MNATALTLASDNRSIDKGLYLGEWAGYYPPQRIRYKEDKHILAFGPTGSGKSTALLVPNLASLRRSIICIDPKGQIAAITARHRATLGRVIVLNPFGVLLDQCPHLKSDRWNPLAQLNPASTNFTSRARAIAQALIDQGDGSGNREFFDASAENILAAFCMWERLKKGAKANLRNVRETLAEGGLTTKLAEMGASEIYAVRVIAKSILRRLRTRNAQSTSLEDVIDTILKNTAFLDDDRIAVDMMGPKMAGGPPIDFTALHREITTIFVILPVGHLDKQAKWLRMFVNLALETLFEDAPPTPPVLPRVLFALDEFGNLGRLSGVIRALQIGRDYRLQVFTLLQNLQQLKRHYPNEWTGFFSAAGACTTFKAGSGDWETAELFSKVLGKRQVELHSYNEGSNTGQSTPVMIGGYGADEAERQRRGYQQGSTNAGWSSGVNTSVHIFDLLPPEDMFRLGKGAMVGLVEPCEMPVRMVTRGYWEMDPHNRLDPNPYFGS